MATARPREQLGALLREILDCPMCASTDPTTLMLQAGMRSRIDKGVRVVAFRAKAIRLECRGCGLRFSINPENLADVYADQRAPDEAEIERKAVEMAADNPARYLEELTRAKAAANSYRSKKRDEILGPHRLGVTTATPRKRRIRFPKA